ncbi:MAG: hypothetical protein HOM38_07380 [Euryarchaeota archaeon]|jgi:hypothetical protein|nr:hypothetical protein [Euryarchaeota archaeon]
MFEEWTYVEWLILAVDVAAIYIVFEFLRRKIKRKLEEVELRQQYALHRRKASREQYPSLPEEE